MKLLEFWIGARYAGLKGRSRGTKDRFISFVANSTMLGIALSVAILIIVMSVMNGFRTQVRDRMLSVLPHVQIYNPYLKPAQQLEQWQGLATQVAHNTHVLGVSPFVAAGAMLSNGQRLRGVEVRGIDPVNEGQVSELPEQIILGSLSSLKPASYEVVLGAQLANALNVTVGDSVLLLAPQGSFSPAGFAPRMKQFKVGGVFSSGHYEYDSGMVFMNAQDAATLFKQSGVAGVRLKLDHMLDAPEIAIKLQADLSSDVVVRDWTQDNRSWFAAVETEKRMMFLILGLLIAIAAFNLLSSLVMTVKDKQSDIAILRTLGATPSTIARIFMVHGSLMGLLGTIVGVGLGCLVAYNIDKIVPFIESLVGVHFLDPSIYFISSLPSEPVLGDIVATASMALILSFLATLYPSWRASRLQPAEVLRHD